MSGPTAVPPLAHILAFALLACGVLGFALVTITRRNLVSAVMALVATFGALAGIFATLSAHFLAILQILVYAGAIMVLFVFVVMMLNREERVPIVTRGIVLRSLGVLAAGYLFYRVAWLIRFERASPVLSASVTPPVPEFGTVAAIGRLLFADFLFPFEAISLTLLVAVVGGVVLTRPARQGPDPGGA